MQEIMHNRIVDLTFSPFPGLGSGHLQTMCASVAWAGVPPPSTTIQIPVDAHDFLYCEESIPKVRNLSNKTIIMVHGLGGSSSSPYMIRISRKLYNQGYRVIRVNLRGASHHGKSRLPYHGGISADIEKVIEYVKHTFPNTQITLLGFSLGGNITLKLMAELHESKKDLVTHAIAICPAYDLESAVNLISLPKHRIYEKYYVKRLTKQAKSWISDLRCSSILEFDNKVTAPLWGFKDAQDYYEKNSSSHVLVHIKQKTSILLADDDPFIDCTNLVKMVLPSSITVFRTKHGGHMGYIGWTGSHGPFWLDRQVLSLVNND